MSGARRSGIVRPGARHSNTGGRSIFDLPRRYLALRRLAEILLIAATLPLTLPLAFGIAVAVRLDSRGPVLYRQERIGRGGRRFTMVKFRSMVAASDTQVGAALPPHERITRIGRFLRPHHLDELPQLWHVLRGEMSLIGPRPAPAVVSETLRARIPGFDLRHVVPPGITGLSQICHGYVVDLDIEESRIKLAYDLYYIRNLSLRLDLLILLKTIPVLLSRFGAR